jgi:hypothetical protein
MDLIKKIEQDIKDYVRSLNTPDNEVYKQNEMLILSCFSKCLEIIEQAGINTVLCTVASEGREEANTCAGGSKCVDIEIEEGYYECEKCGRTSRG